MVCGLTVSPTQNIPSFELLLDLPIKGDYKDRIIMKLYVGNLPFQTSSFELQELFSGVGAVESATVIEDRETGRSRGFGFVEMASQEEGERAIAELNGTEHNGRELKVNEAKPREDRGGFGGGRGGRGNGGGGRGGYGGGGGYQDFGGGRNRW